MSEEHAKFAVEKVADESVKARNAQLGTELSATTAASSLLCCRRDLLCAAPCFCRDVPSALGRCLSVLHI